MNDEPRFDGERVVIGGTTRVVPPIALRALVRIMPTIARLSTTGDGAVVATTEEQVDAAFDILHASLSRNYPEISREELNDLVLPGEFTAALQAVLRVSGFVAVTEKNGSPPAPSSATRPRSKSGTSSTRGS